VARDPAAVGTTRLRSDPAQVVAWLRISTKEEGEPMPVNVKNPQVERLARGSRT
jgi:hypothetical protein